MLQQTQVSRVIPKYHAFVKQFPTVRALAHATLRDVLVAWQGLGYNRRAKMLHETAKRVAREYAGRMPRTYDELVTLPGVGPYTAGAICVFAYNQPVPLIETNIRTVLFHHLLQGWHSVSDHELMELVTRLQGRKEPRSWYWALMDYGSHLKEEGVRLNHKSKHHVKQSRFKGSDREARGAILKVLAQHRTRTQQCIVRDTSIARGRVATQLMRLKKEGMVVKKGTSWSL